VTRLQKKLIIGLLAVALITPIGILLPEWFKSGNSWGEWSKQTIMEKMGFVPAGMEKDAKLWKAPLPDYNFSKEESSLVKKSGSYLLSGFVGIAVISLLSFSLFKFMKKE
jgi:cobalt/nickel transport protein